jgi:hypothetical protein
MLAPCTNCHRPHRTELSCPFCGHVSRSRASMLAIGLAGAAMLAGCRDVPSVAVYGGPPPAQSPRAEPGAIESSRVVPSAAVSVPIADAAEVEVPAMNAMYGAPAIQATPTSSQLRMPTPGPPATAPTQRSVPKYGAPMPSRNE